MKSLRPELMAAYRSGVTSLARCVRIVRTDGVVHRLTARARSITMSNGQVYDSDGGFSADTAVRNRIGVEPDGSVDLELALVPAGVPVLDIRLGRLDGAELFAFQTLADDPVEDDHPLGYLRFGETVLRGSRYVAPLRSVQDLLALPIGRVITPSCDATLGDARCTVDLGPLTVAGTIAERLSDVEYLVAEAEAQPEDFFGLGLMRLTSGTLSGLELEITEHAGQNIVLAEPPVELPAVGDAVELVPGCRKRLAEDCIAKFDNALNHQGYPDVPGESFQRTFGPQQ